MLNLDLKRMLDVMSKQAILDEVATQIDVAISKKVEEEETKRLEAVRVYEEARKRVSDETYTSEDLVVLQKHLNDKRKTVEKMPSPSFASINRATAHEMDIRDIIGKLKF